MDAHTFCFSVISGPSNQQTSHKHPNLNIRDFLNCVLKCLALGRLGIDFGEREETLKNGETKARLVRVTTKFKAVREERESDGHGPPHRCAQGQRVGFERADVQMAR